MKKKKEIEKKVEESIEVKNDEVIDNKEVEEMKTGATSTTLEEENRTAPNKTKIEKKVKNKNKIIELIKKYKLVIGIVVLATILLIVASLFVKPKSNVTFKNSPLVYLDTDGLIFWNGKDEKIVIDEEYKKDDNDYLTVAFAHENENLISYINDSSLIIYNIKNKKSEKLASNISDILGFSKNDKYLVYKDNNDGYFAYNINNNSKDKIVSAKEDQYISFIDITDKKAIYYISEENDDDEYERTLYTFDLDKNDVNKVSNGISSTSGLINDNFVYYLKGNNEYALYSYDVKKDKSEKVDRQDG